MQKSNIIWFGVLLVLAGCVSSGKIINAGGSPENGATLYIGFCLSDFRNYQLNISSFNDKAVIWKTGDI